MAEKLQLSQSDRRKVWWRLTFLQGSWNYERMQNLGWAYALMPAIKKLYTTKEDRAAALERHLEFFNTHPYVAAPIMGVTMALEEERANGAEIDDTAIQGVKIGMMGPLAVLVTQSSGTLYVLSWELLVLHLLLLVTSWDQSSSSLVGTSSVWLSYGTHKKSDTVQVLTSLKTCLVVSSKKSLKGLQSSVCSSSRCLLNVGYL